MQELYKKAFTVPRGGNFEFIKFHLLTHYPDSIVRYGAQPPLNRFHYEVSLKDLVKVPYNISGKKAQVGMQLVYIYRFPFVFVCVCFWNYHQPLLRTRLLDCLLLAYDDGCFV